MNPYKKAAHTDILPDLDNLAPVTTNGASEAMDFEGENPYS